LDLRSQISNIRSQREISESKTKSPLETKSPPEMLERASLNNPGDFLLSHPDASGFTRAIPSSDLRLAKLQTFGVPKPHAIMSAL
jgi:hypothetical protein